MERLTIRKSDFAVAKRGSDALSVFQAIDRLADIEDILGDDYDLDRLKVLINQRMTMREEVAERFSITRNVPVDRLRELVGAYLEGRCVIADVPPSGGRYVLRTMCAYYPDCYRIGSQSFQQKKCEGKVPEETGAKEEAGFGENTGGA